MKKWKRTLSAILAFTFCFALAITVSAAEMEFRGIVLLGAAQSEATSAGYGGIYGKGKVINHDRSAQSVYFELQSSAGTSWKVVTTLYADPGRTISSNIWSGGIDQLWRIRVAPKTVSPQGYPGCIADGYIYTGAK